MSDLPNKPWFWVRELPAYCQVCIKTIYNWIERGEIEVQGPKYKQRVSRESLLRKLGGC